MLRLTYTCNDNATRFLPCLRKAAAVWNDVLSDLVHLSEWRRPLTTITTTVQSACNIVVTMDGAPRTRIRNIANPTRVAQCQRIATDYWQITLSNDVKWATSAWSRFWGTGENALAALVHELGHVFKLPHASDPSHVMHSEIGGSGHLSPSEKDAYRHYFLATMMDQVLSEIDTRK